MVKLVVGVQEVETDSWAEIAEQQSGLDEEEAITPDRFVEADVGEVLAMYDRNRFDQPFERRVFVMLGDDEVYVFREDGSRIDEPSNFVVDGAQPLEGDESFISDWKGEGGDSNSAYYRLATVGSPPPSPEPPPPPKTPLQGSLLAQAYARRFAEYECDEPRFVAPPEKGERFACKQRPGLVFKTSSSHVGILLDEGLEWESHTTGDFLSFSSRCACVLLVC